MKALQCAAAWLLFSCLFCSAQSDEKTYSTPSSHDLQKLSAEYDHLSDMVTRQSMELLHDLQAKETKLSRQLARKDSGTAAKVFSGAGSFYQQMEISLLPDPAALALHPLKEYLPKIDSLQTTLQFLNLQQLSGTKSAAVTNLLEKVQLLQGQLQKANEVSTLITQRQQQLQAALAQYNLSTYLSGYSQKAYYYKAQLQQYKNLLNHPDQLSDRILSVVRNTNIFQHYFRNNSYLSSLFRVPGSTAPIAMPSNTSLQTRGQVNSMVAARLGKGANFTTAVNGQANSTSSGNPLAGSMGQAQSAMNALKSKIAQYGGGSSSTAVPDFQPNSQHNKSLWKRLEYGINLQSTHTAPLLPATTDLALTVGYKASDRLVFGVGGGLKFGWGEPFEHISLSGQGASVRSYLNWKIRGSWWLAGGYEANYYNAFSELAQLIPVQAWQRSALIGIQRTYRAGKRTGNIQLLFDLLYRQEIPQPQPLIFRVGYSL